MKFALCNEIFESRSSDSGFDFAGFFEFARSCGYEGAEIAPFTISTDAFKIDEKRRAAIRREAETAGIEITGLHWLLAKTDGGFYMTSPDKAVRSKTVDYFAELARLCSDLGGKYMVCGSPKQRSLLPGVTTEQAGNYAADLFSRLIPALERNGVTLAIEPLGPSETDFLTNAADTIRLLDRIGAPSQIALHLDCKAMSAESKSIPEIISNSRNHLVYVHVNDPNLLAPGFGELDFTPIMSALRGIGYDGWLSLEVFEKGPGPELMAEKSIGYLKNILKTL